MVDIVILGITQVLVGGTRIGLRHGVHVDFALVVPDTRIFETPEGVERITGNITVHHIRVVTRGRIGGHEVFRADIFHQLFVVRESQGRGPTEVLVDNVLALDGQLDTPVGGDTDVAVTGRITGLGRHL